MRVVKAPKGAFFMDAFFAAIGAKPMISYPK
jgi:hypothetical protein